MKCQKQGFKLFGGQEKYRQTSPNINLSSSCLTKFYLLRGFWKIAASLPTFLPPLFARPQKNFRHSELLYKYWLRE
jgi:hypothetical protein